MAVTRQKKSTKSRESYFLIFARNKNSVAVVSCVKDLLRGWVKDPIKPKSGFSRGRHGGEFSSGLFQNIMMDLITLLVCGEVSFNLQHISRGVLGCFVGSLLVAEIILKSFRIGQKVLLCQLLSLPGRFMSADCCLYALVKPCLFLPWPLPRMIFTDTDCAGVQGSTSCMCMSAN